MSLESASSDGTFQLLRPNDAAKVLAVSPRKLWELTAAKEIECIRIGRSVRYTLESLKRFAETSRVRAIH